MKFKIKVAFENLPEEQLKVFKDEESAIEWCRRNHEKIIMINYCTTKGRLLNHYELKCIFKNPWGLALNMGDLK